jgi:tetratricopeptide (TPR) repeat protein
MRAAADSSQLDVRAAEALVAIGHDTRAVRILTRNDHAGTEILLAIALWNAGDASAAEATLRSRFDPADWRHHQLLAWMLTHSGREADARPHADEAFRLAPGEPAAAGLAGVTAVLLRDSIAARVAAARLRELLPSSGKADELAGHADLLAGRWVDAEGHYRAAAGDTDCAYSTLVHLSVALECQRREVEAIKAADEARQREPSGIEAWTRTSELIAAWHRKTVQRTSAAAAGAILAALAAALFDARLIVVSAFLAVVMVAMLVDARRRAKTLPSSVLDLYGPATSPRRWAAEIGQLGYLVGAGAIGLAFVTATPTVAIAGALAVTIYAIWALVKRYERATMREPVRELTLEL